MKKLFSLIALLCLCGSGVWADKEWQLAWADYFEDAAKIKTHFSWSSENGITVTHSDRSAMDGVNGNYYYALDASSNDRTWTYTIGNAYTANAVEWSKYTFSPEEAYKLEFDLALRSDMFNNSSGKISTFTIPNIATVDIINASTSATFTAVNSYDADADGTNEIEAGESLFTINVANAYNNTAAVFGKTFYHYIIEGNATGTTLTVFGPYSEGTLPSTPLYSAKVSNTKIDITNITGKLQRYQPGFGLDNVTLYKEVEAGVVEKPTATITVVNGGIRRIQFSCLTAGVAFSYSTDHGANFIDCPNGYLDINSNTSLIVKATKGSTSEVSDEYDFEAGTNIALTTPAFRVTALTENASGAFYPTITATCDNSGVLLNPTAIVTAKFNGETVVLPFVATQDGQLVVTATCAGYTSSQDTYNVTSLVKAVLADFTNVSSVTLPTPGIIRKVSGSDHWELEEGVGLKAVRVGSNSWFQIDRAGMVAYDEVSADKSSTNTIIDVANDNTANNSLKYVSPGKYVAKIYYFTEGKGLKSTAELQGYKTFYSATTNYEVDANTKIYKAEAFTTGGDEVTLTEVDADKIIPAGTPVIIKNATAPYQMTLTATATDSSNDFYGNALAVAAGGETGKYILAYTTAGGLAFYQYSPALAAGDVYLDATAAGKAIRIKTGETTGIENVASAKVATKAVKRIMNGQLVIEKAGKMFNAAGAQVK